MNEVDQKDLKTLILFAATKQASGYIFSKPVAPLVTPFCLCGLAYYLHETGKKKNTPNDHYANIKNGGSKVFDSAIKASVDTVKYIINK